MAWTTMGDATGFHVLTAEEKNGYAWREVANLNKPGLETDRWIGNACSTESGRRLVITYAPRAFTNKASLFQRGGFTAIVDLRTSRVTPLSVRGTLAYFNPGCGAGEEALITQQRGGELDGFPLDTRLFRVDTRTGAVAAPVTFAGQVTSATPVHGGIVAAAGRRLVSLNGSSMTTVERTHAVPFRLVSSPSGSVTFMDHVNGQAEIKRVASLQAPHAQTLARGDLDATALTPGARGSAWITGKVKTSGALPPDIRLAALPIGTELSSLGHLAILHDQANSAPGGEPAREHDPAADLPAQSHVSPVDEPSAALLNVQLTHSGERIKFAVPTNQVAPSPPTTDARGDSTMAGPIPPGLLPGPDPVTGATDPSAAKDPTDPDATCSVVRNDAKSQVYQPTPRQVEWAADQAVVGNLNPSRSANWKQSGLPTWTPQGLFPSIPLNGGGRVNVQVLLGIMAQESNLWQASGHALSGVTGNPLVGNFYGRDVYDADPNDDWDIDFTAADCGYGITQITDGMRKASAVRPGETALPANSQRAVALDYATNIAAGLRILQDKWNQTQAAGLVHSDGDPKWLENWFFAVWAYNSGFHADAHDGTPWGVGWLNNPANPNYPANRAFFNKVAGDAAHPQDWPYPEKVMGWAAYSISTIDGAGFRTAWWVNTSARDLAKPPIYAFCSTANTCDSTTYNTPNAPEVASDPAGPCYHENTAGQYDLKCWWHDPITFNNCASGYCGNELWRFDTTYPEQSDGTHYPPNCVLAGLPSGARIIDDVPDNVGSVRSNCGHPWTNAGTFSMRFASDAQGRFPSKVDFHQIGGGFGGHFYFGHTRQAGDLGGKMQVTGTWTFSEPLATWGRVLVHIPDHGAHTQQAKYVINLGNGTTKARFALQRTQEHRWVSLGTMLFAGTPSITLSSDTYDGRGADDIAFDAVAIAPLSAKPANFVVALGDSYSSGEGASDPTDGDDYYKETDNNGALDDDRGRNSCHRSPFAWSRLGTLADKPTTSIGSRADSWDPTLDFQLHACSGALTRNLLPYYTASSGFEPTNAFGQQGRGQYGEVSQLDKGYLDENTTLVTLSIGGNDARFADIIKECIYGAGLFACPDTKLSGESEDMKTTIPRNIDGPVRDSILTVLQQIRSRAPNAKILLMGYPRLLENDGQCVLGIGTAEAPWLNQMADRMDSMLAGVATTATSQLIPVTMSDPRDEFAGMAVCGNPETVHGIVEDTTAGDKPKTLGLLPPSQQSFHPKKTGTPNYAASFVETLRRMAL